MMCSHFFPFRCCYCNMAHLKCSGTCHPQLIILVQTTNESVQTTNESDFSKFQTQDVTFYFYFFLGPFSFSGWFSQSKTRFFICPSVVPPTGSIRTFKQYIVHTRSIFQNFTFLCKQYISGNCI